MFYRANHDVQMNGMDDDGGWAHRGRLTGFGLSIYTHLHSLLVTHANHTLNTTNIKQTKKHTHQY